MKTLIRLADAVITNWIDIVRIFNWMRDNEATIGEMADYLNPVEPTEPGS